MWVLVRTVSARRFKHVPTINLFYLFIQYFKRATYLAQMPVYHMALNNKKKYQSFSTEKFRCFIHFKNLCNLHGQVFVSENRLCNEHRLFFLSKNKKFSMCFMFLLKRFKRVPIIVWFCPKIRKESVYPLPFPVLLYLKNMGLRGYLVHKKVWIYRTYDITHSSSCSQI